MLAALLLLLLLVILLLPLPHPVPHLRKTAILAGLAA
jgi:hypothetical protein